MVRLVCAGNRITPHVVSASANNVFGRYKKEEPHEVRKPDVAGQSYLEQARRTRQMLREANPEVVKQVIEFHRKLNFVEALALAQKEGKMVVPNIVHDRIITTDYEYLTKNYPVWTGTLIIYEAPGIPFGEQVICTDEIWFIRDRLSVTFNTPLRFLGRTNCALVVEHPDFEVIDLGDKRYEIRVLDGANVHLIKNFPIRKYGWYVPHTKTGIPQGKAVGQSKDTRYLQRIEDAYILPLVRGVYVDGDGCGVDAGRLTFNKFGVALVSL